MKPSIPKGTRDFGASELRKRYYIINTIKGEFERFGYAPLETPVMENLSTLTGKYGDEGEKLLYRILNSGNFLDGIDASQLSEMSHKQLQTQIAEKGLRYDLTIPFARYVVMNQSRLAFPFKRYQIQPVWRADRPQRGRYREFYQCDADVIGTNSLLNEAELTQLYDRVFAQLKIPVTIHLNNRKILAAMAETAQQSDRLTDITVAIDKLDKIGMDGVRRELTERGIDETAQNTIADFLRIEGSPEVVLAQLAERFANSEMGKKGIAEMKTLLQYLQTATDGGSPLANHLKIDLTLARGLNYYTGTIYEVKTNIVQMGSLGGGGRYDDLTGAFGLKGMSGVGISFGLDRIYDVLEETKGFAQIDQTGTTRLLLINFGGAAEQYAFRLLTQLRQSGICAELYPEPAKLDKQMKYANAQQIPYVGFTGDEEMARQQVKIKNMTSGEQKSVAIADAISLIK